MNERAVMPNLFVPGFAKSGTSHLCSVLSRSDDIFLPHEKEPHYFSDDLVPDSYRTNESTYLSFYHKAMSRYRLDGSVSYMYSHRAFENIVSACDAPCFLILVRHPFDRMVSHYKFNVRNGVEKRSFPDAVRNLDGFKQQWLYDYYEMSDYDPQVKRLLNSVESSTQVRMIDYRDYREDPEGVVGRIAEYLEVDVPLDEMLHKVVNVSKKPKFPLINDIIRVDKGWKQVAKSAIPFKLRRSIKKYVHNKNISEVDIPYMQDRYTDELKSEFDEMYVKFMSEYRGLYI
ncbi:Sulfotransferase family protein [Onishia taeanensis]|uniref:Sulfotransferase family protein n=1 Tax=Onishia taeanensis TaxID=284577 RepID=A0A1G7QL09_9GAMM|nr:sulfotransferase [Halomonas taeanensis]SDF99227.1 Sulfotransferase family protein [Halomonas taeanensis]